MATPNHPTINTPPAQATQSSTVISAQEQQSIPSNNPSQALPGVPQNPPGGHALSEKIDYASSLAHIEPEVKAIEFPKSVTVQLVSVRIGDFTVQMLSELVHESKKQKWVRAKADFTKGNIKMKRFHVVKAHALGLRTLGEAIGYFELFEEEKYANVVKNELRLPDIDPGFKLKGRAAKRKIPSTIPDFKPIERKSKSS